MAIVTKEKLENADIDVDDLAAIVNGSTTVTTRLGGDKLSVDQALSQIIVGEVTVYSAAATYTNIEDWVEFSGVVYRPLPSALPIGPEAFNATNWSVAQGFATADNVDLTVNSLSRTSVQSYLENAQVPDYAALIANAAQYANGDVVEVNRRQVGQEGGGSFLITTTDLSAEAANDPEQGIIIELVASSKYAVRRLDTPEVNALWFGVKADSDNDTVAMQAAVNYCVTAASPDAYLNLSPFNGVMPTLALPPGVIKTDTVTIAGSVYVKGQLIGSYAGTVWSQLSENINLVYLDGDDDNNSNASVFEGIRFKSGSATSADVSQIAANDTISGINSIYFYRCWFQSPERYAATVVGDDWRFNECTFDVSAFNFIRLGTSTRASTNAKFIGNTYFEFAQWMFTAVNATGVQVISGKAYASGGVDFDQATPNQMGSFFNNQSNIHPRGDIQIDSTQINDVEQVAQSNRPNFRMRHCFGANVGGDGVNVVGIGGGGELLGYDLTSNEFETVGACVGIDMAGTAVRRSKIKDNVFTSSDGNGVRAYNIADSRNDDNDFSGNRDFLFSSGSNWINYALNKMNYRVATSVINPASIAAGAVWPSPAETVSGARTGGTVVLDPTSGSWPLPDGIDAEAYVSASDSVVIRYTNTTSGAIDPPAHQLYMTVLPRDN